MTTSLFTYGTLMAPAVMRAVSGRLFASQPASLDGHIRRSLRGAVYPGIIPGPGSVTGVLYRGLDPHALTRCDQFEGNQYVRRSVHVTAASGDRVCALCYILAPAARHLMTDADWDFDQFMRLHLARYLGNVHR